jgi:dipeptidase
VPFRDFDNSTFFRFKEGATEKQILHTYSYLWFEMPGQNFADSYMNEHGVLVTSNSCPSKELFGEIKDGGIGYELRRLIAERALSARTGVELAGQLVEKWGYNASGRTYTIADKSEAWLFSVVRGKIWVARRVPDDQVAFIPNYYTIKNIDLSDKDNILASKDLISYAERRGWYEKSRDGDFNFTKVYSSQKNLTDIDNIGRMWMGVKLLSGKDFKRDDDFPFSFIPSEKIGLKQIMTVLANHFEGTDLDDSGNYSKGSPHKNKTFSICSETQQLSFIAELRAGLPFDVGGRIWVAPRRGCVNPYMPIYFTAFEKHFSRDQSIYDKTKPMAWWSFDAVAELSDKEYRRVSNQRKKTKEELMQLWLKSAEKLEKEYLPIYKKQPAKAAAMINSFQAEVLNKAVMENNAYLGKK